MPEEYDLNIMSVGCYFVDDLDHLVGGGQRRIGHLKAGDRVLTLSQDGQHLIEDEVTIVMHAALRTPNEY